MAKETVHILGSYSTLKLNDDKYKYFSRGKSLCRFKIVAEVPTKKENDLIVTGTQRFFSP